MAFALTIAAAWMIALGHSQREVSLGVIAGLWAALVAAFTLFSGQRHANVLTGGGFVGSELEIRQDYAVELQREATARRAYEQQLHEMVRREMGHIQQTMSDQIGQLRQDVSGLRGELVEKVGGQIRLERIETTRVIGSDIEALQNEVRRLARGGSANDLLGVASTDFAKEFAVGNPPAANGSTVRPSVPGADPSAVERSVAGEASRFGPPSLFPATRTAANAGSAQSVVASLSAGAPSIPRPQETIAPPADRVAPTSVTWPATTWPADVPRAYLSPPPSVAQTPRPQPSVTELATPAPRDSQVAGVLTGAPSASASPVSALPVARPSPGSLAPPAGSRPTPSGPTAPWAADPFAGLPRLTRFVERDEAPSAADGPNPPDAWRRPSPSINPPARPPAPADSAAVAPNGAATPLQRRHAAPEEVLPPTSEAPLPGGRRRRVEGDPNEVLTRLLGTDPS